MFLRSDSERSTLTVEDTIIKQHISPAGSKLRVKKRVRFDENSNWKVDNFRQSAEDCRETWYSPWDYLSFRASTHEMLQSARAAGDENGGETFSRLLVTIYGACAHVNFVLEDATGIVDGLEEELVDLYQGQCHWIGLESLLARVLKHDSRRRRCAIRNTVLEIQNEYRRGLWSPDNVGQELWESCRNYSQTSCLFAQLVARAQLLA